MTKPSQLTGDNASWFEPDWPLPAGVKALVTTRQGGVSVGPYGTNNLGLHVQDCPQSVETNRAALLSYMGVEHIQWLEQIHSIDVVEAQPDQWVRTADASFTRQSGLALAIMTADCVPVLFASQDGSEVAAAHAGWRGLAQGVLAETVKPLNASGQHLSAYIGPCISQHHFEVGVDVLEVFFAGADNPEQMTQISACFLAHPLKPLHFLADLTALTRLKLQALGVEDIYTSQSCTYADVDDFYSYRRDSLTGRFASLIWKTML